MVTVECVEKLIRKDMVDPVTGEKLTDRDIIVLQRVSGTPPPCPLAFRQPRPASRGPTPLLRPRPTKGAGPNLTSRAREPRRHPSSPTPLLLLLLL